MTQPTRIDEPAGSPPGEQSVLETGFQTEQVLTVAGGHFVHDTFSAFIAPLLPLLQERLGTTYALTGGLAVFAQLPSVLNPFIGYLADRVSLRYFVILAPAVTATLMSSMGLVSSYMLLALLLLAGGVSIAAFHAPAPAMIGRLAGGRVGQGMSFFMAGGELGRTLGPVVVVAAVGWFGLGGIWRLALAGWLVSGILYWRLRQVSARPAAQRPAGQAEFWARARPFFLVFGLLMLLRSFMMVSLTTYLPIYMSDVARTSLWLAAGALTVLEGAGVVGALFSGTLSDRLGRRRMLAFLLAISPALMLLFIYAPGWLAAPLLIALGLTAISPTPVMLAAVQDHFPRQRALANGLYLGMNFLVRAVGIWLVGVAADRFGLTAAFTGSALLAFLSLAAVWYLPVDRMTPIG